MIQVWKSCAALSKKAIKSSWRFFPKGHWLRHRRSERRPCPRTRSNSKGETPPTGTQMMRHFDRDRIRRSRNQLALRLSNQQTRDALVLPALTVWMIAWAGTFILGVVDTWQGFESIPVKLLVNVTLDSFMA